MKDFYDKKNLKTLQKEIAEGIRKWKVPACSGIGRTDVMKMALLHKAIYVLPINIPTQSFTSLERTVFCCIWKDKNPGIAKRVLNNKRTAGGLTI